MAEIKYKVGKGRGLNGQSIEVVRNVYKFMKEEGKNGGVIIPIQKARERAAVATGVSQRTISTINMKLQTLRLSEEENKCFKSPKKTRNKIKPITGIDSFDAGVVRRLVYAFYITEKRLPTAKLLHNSLKEKLDFTGSEQSVRRILKDLGFSWKRAENNRRILIEKSEIRDKRITYLQALKKYRSEGRPIIYMDETYVCSDHISSKIWSDGSCNILHTPISKGDRLIIVHAGGEQGFVPNALAIWKAGIKSGDYHANMNTANYVKWVTSQLVPNLQPHTVLVIDNAKYHNTQLDKAPTSNSRKDEMIKWLTERNIWFESSMLKPQLYKIILQHKPLYVKYVLDSILEEEGHSVLRLPPYHPDLNPIEMIWADVKNFIASHNTTFKISDVQKVCEDKFSSITQEHWKAKCEHVKKAEKEYIAKEPAIDEITESFIIRLDSESDSEESGDESDGLSGIEEL